MTEIEELKHRLEMIKDEHNVLQKMIVDNPLISIPISNIKTPYNHNIMECFNNIGIVKPVKSDVPPGPPFNILVKPLYIPKVCPLTVSVTISVNKNSGDILILKTSIILMVDFYIHTSSN